MEFDDVISRSKDVASFNKNVREYFKQHNSLSDVEKKKHYWALLYKWKESFLEGS